jgi:hypothetical protein
MKQLHFDMLFASLLGLADLAATGLLVGGKDDDDSGA